MVWMAGKEGEFEGLCNLWSIMVQKILERGKFY
jgi:hypothetical protein